MIATIIVIILLIILVGYIIYIFNKIINASNLNLEAFSNLDSVLKERYELIPNLEKMVSECPNYEQSIIDNINEVKEKLSEKMTVSDRQKQEDKYSAVIKQVLIQIENYPNLKSGDDFSKFKDALTRIEKEIEIVRRSYNDTTRNYNAFIQKCPNSILASILGYSKRAFFEVDLLTKENVQIDFEDRRKTPR